MTRHNQARVGFCFKMAGFWTALVWKLCNHSNSYWGCVSAETEDLFFRCRTGIASNANYYLSRSSAKFMLDFQHRLQPLTQVNHTLNCFIKWGWN